MKKLLFLSFLIVSAKAYSQIDWSNYSTSFENSNNRPSLGVAIPYNGNYDNFKKNIVGTSNWNPQYKLGIDTTLDDQMPLFFVYDTTGIFFLVPYVTKKNTLNFEFTVLLNNKITITPWSHVSRFTKVTVGDMDAGSGVTGLYRASIGQYLVAYLKNRAGQIISSMVIYFKKDSPEITSISTSDNALAFSTLTTEKSEYNRIQPDIGWHREYTGNFSGKTNILKLPNNENNVLININSNIYRRDALEYALYRNGKEIRKWISNELDNHYILLKNLTPGDYRILIRFKRQRNNAIELRLSILSIWYKTVAFKAVVLTVLVLVAAFLSFVSKYRAQKKVSTLLSKKTEKSTEELKNIYALLNPHFTFNALGSIQGLVNKGDVDAASKYLSSFGELLRETLKESKADHISITKELENLKLYIDIEQLRHPFTYNLNVDSRIDIFSTTIPPFLLQPFVENSIKHGISKMNGRGEVRISINKTGDVMMVRIADNGPGFDPVLINEGYGLSLSRRRIDALNRDYGEELIRLQLERSREEFIILLSFKNWL
ncbi:MAG TPA: histidine kinase [Candidatus Babeliaceae bacterium]|nr:histidine kinase [Candidatus Babeliaceae bacterium]